MENIGDEYRNYWETNMFLQIEELGSFFDYDYDSSSPEETQSSSMGSKKNIVSERNRRKKLNERLYALRSVVPNITKMDKASTIRDAIEYIKLLQEEERMIKAEISELEATMSIDDGANFDIDHQQSTTFIHSKSKRQRMDYAEESTPIEVLELSVCKMGEKTMVVNLRCSKRRDTMIKLCEAFESLKLNIITCTITHFSGSLFNTIFIQGDDEEEEKDVLRVKIETAIATMNGSHSRMSS